MSPEKLKKVQSKRDQIVNNNENNNTNKKLQLTTTHNMEHGGLTTEEYGQLIVGRFRKSIKIGTGSFGDVFKGYDIITKREVAIKQELRQSKTFNREIEIIKHLQIMDSNIGIPTLYYDGTQVQSGHRIFVMELMGKNLSELHKLCGGTFTCPTICMIAAEIITRFEELHKHGVIHRDIKPQNFLIGLKSSDKKIYACDFGLSGRFIDESGNHILFQTGLKPIGTARYASIRVHRGYERSRRDDFEALSYMLIYLMVGVLPWQGLKLKNRTHKWKVILAKKKETAMTELCLDCPTVLADFVAYCRAMRFNQRPKYAYWRKRFLDTMNNLLEPNTEFKYDWENSDEHRR